MFVVAVAMQSRERKGLVRIFPDLRQGPILVGTVAYVVAPVRLVGVEHVLELSDDGIVGSAGQLRCGKAHLK